MVDFAVGQRLTASLMQEFSDAVTPRVFSKPGSTARQSTTTLADDPDLTGIPLLAGTYEIELMIFYTVANTTPRLKTRWSFSGTWNNPIRSCFGPANVAAPGGGPEAMQEITVRGYAADSQDAIYNSTTSGAFSAVRELTRQAVISTAGNLSLQWAQNSSSANNVTLQAQTCFCIRQIE